MKKILLISFFSLLLSAVIVQAQDIPEGAIMINENTVIKDENGKRVDMKTFGEYVNSGDWTIEPVKDKDGKVSYHQLKKTTDEEKEEMLKRFDQIGDSELTGKPAPSFSIIDSDANKISSENTKGKIVVLNFWFIACKPCVQEIPELNEVYERFKDNDEVVFASITFDDKKEVQEFLTKHPIHYPLVTNETKIAKDFQVNGFPTNIVIDKNGNIIDLVSGGFSGISAHISNAIEKALK